MTQQQIEYVLTLSKTGSFSKAARKLCVSQPSLSQFIINLENQLGAQLFDRSTSPVRLTAAGEAYIKAAVQIKALEENLRNEIADMGSLKSGTLRIGATMFRASCMLPKSITEFCRRFDGISVSVTEGSSVQLLEQVLSGEIDLFIGTGKYDSKLFEAEHLADERMILALPRGSHGEIPEKCRLTAEDIRASSMKYLTAEPIDLRKISGERLIICDDGEFSADRIDGILAQHSVDAGKILRVRSIETAFAFVKAGFGASFVPDSLIRFGDFAEHPDYCLLPDLAAKTGICLVYRKNGYLSKAAREYGLLLKQLVSIGTWRLS